MLCGVQLWAAAVGPQNKRPGAPLPRVAAAPREPDLVLRAATKRPSSFPKLALGQKRQRRQAAAMQAVCGGWQALAHRRALPPPADAEEPATPAWKRVPLSM